MKRHKFLRSHRRRDYNYSKPAVHHILLETKGDAGILAMEKDGITSLHTAGCRFLDTLGQALHNFPVISVLAMSMTPSTVELCLEITEWRNKQPEPKKGTREWIQWRRTMTLPVFVGFLKTNSAMLMNEETGSTGTIWTRRYRERVLSSAEDIAVLQSELADEWSRVVVSTPEQEQKNQNGNFISTLYRELGIAIPERHGAFFPAESTDRLHETMILGRVMLLTDVRQSVSLRSSASAKTSKGGSSGGKGLQRGLLIRTLGPGRIFLSE